MDRFNQGPKDDISITLRTKRLRVQLISDSLFNSMLLSVILTETY
jgi:hypothetical protein